MSVNKDLKYIANSDYVLREIVGEFMLIPTGRLSMTSNGVVTISESAAFLWRNLSEAKTISQLCNLLLEEYDVDKETAFNDITELVAEMAELKVLKKV